MKVEGRVVPQGGRWLRQTNHEAKWLLWPNFTCWPVLNPVPWDPQMLWYRYKDESRLNPVMLGVLICIGRNTNSHSLDWSHIKWFMDIDIDIYWLLAISQVDVILHFFRRNRISWLRPSGSFQLKRTCLFKARVPCAIHGSPTMSIPVWPCGSQTLEYYLWMMLFVESHRCLCLQATNLKYFCQVSTPKSSEVCYSTKSCQWDRGPVLSTMFATFSMDLSMLSLKNVTTQPVTASYSLISHSEYSGPRLCDGFGWSDLCHGFGIFEPETL